LSPQNSSGNSDHELIDMDSRVFPRKRRCSLCLIVNKQRNNSFNVSIKRGMGGKLFFFSMIFELKKN